LNLKEIPPHTLITGVVAVAWLGSFGIRAVVPDFALGTAADALMTTTVGYWFTAQKRAGKGDGGGDLLGELVNKNVLPMIAGASPPPAGPTPPSATPPAPPRPPQPPPPSTTKGGLPWGS
jgi:hypothetical protein